MQNRESQYKHQSRNYNVQRKSDVNHIGMKMKPNYNFSIIKCY